MNVDIWYLQSCDNGDLRRVSSPPCPQCSAIHLLICATQAYEPFKVLSRTSMKISLLSLTSHLLLHLDPTSLSGGCHLPAKTSPGNGSRMPCPVSSNRRLCTSRCSLSSLALSSISQKSRDFDEFTPLVLDNTDVDVDEGEHAARPLPLLPGLPGQGCQPLSWPQEKACKWPSKDFQVKRFDPHGNCFSWWPFHKSSKSTMQWMADFVDMFMYMHVSILVVVITKPCCLKGMSREDKAATNSSTPLLLPAALISDLKTWHSFEKKQCSKRQLKYSSGIWRFDCSLDS